MKKWIYYICVILFAAVFIVSISYLGYYYWDAQMQQSRYETLSQLRPAANVRPEPTQSAQQDQIIPDPLETVEIVDPKTGEKRQVLAEFAELYRINNDIIGWLSIPAIDVDYPVMHTPEDPEYYLKRNFDKKKHTAGCLFAAGACDPQEPSDNIIIYGHRMKNGTMFGNLDKFKKASFCKENPYIYFDTLEELHTYEILYVFLTTASVGEGFAYHQFINTENQEDFDAFINQCQKLSVYNANLEAKFGDKLITLSTCDYSSADGRLVLVAKQIA